MLSIVVDARACDSVASPAIFVVRGDDAETRSLPDAAERDRPAAAPDSRRAVDEARWAS